MTRSKKRALLALALSAVGVLVMASVASATHPRPNYAGKVTVNLVPAFDACTAATPPNRTHGPPLGAPSCNPPVKTSNALTIGAQMTGSIKISVIAGVPGPPEDSDVKIIAAMTDVRCDTSTNCGSTNASGGADYTGILQGTATIRITDHWNSTGPSGGPDAATVVDLPFPVGATCTATASTAVGSDCGVNTSANAVVGGTDPTAKDGKRAVVEISQLFVKDGGVTGTTPTENFLTQGIFIP